MLEAHEFAVGSLSQAQPGSVVLPRSERDEAFLIGSIGGITAAVILSGSNAFHCFGSEGNTSWRGIIIPYVRIEVDPASAFDPDRVSAPLGSIIRSSTTLSIRAPVLQVYGDDTYVDLVDGLTDAGGHHAAFTDWQIFIGTGHEKRILWTYKSRD